MRKYSASICLILVLAVLTLTFGLGLVSGLDLTIEQKAVSSQAIIEIERPAIFDLTITNNEQSATTVEIYTLVGRVDLKPEHSFIIAGNATTTVTLEAYPRDIPGYFSFEYKIKDTVGNIQTDDLAINIVNLEDAFSLYADNINPDSTTAVIHFDNLGGHEFTNIEAEFSSVFFNKQETFSLAANEKKNFIVDIDTEKANELLAGPYILNAKLKLEGKTVTVGSLIRFTEQSGVDTTETIEGFLLRRHETTKTNRGNIPVNAEVVVKKNFFPAMFTTFNIAPSNKDTVGFNKYYIFESVLSPGEELRVVTKTNWWILILIIVGIIIIAYLAKKFLTTKLRLIKKATFVKTKGGEFALKISIIVKAKDFVERIKVIDRLPGMVKLYERYGTITPDRIDQKNKRIEWNIESLDKGEERVFSYIIYSKIGIVGKFELPEAEALYEFKGQLKDISSNKSYFINEPGKKKPKIQKMVDDLL